MAQLAARRPPTRLLARLMGPSLMALSVTEAFHADIFVENTPPVVYFNGSVLFVAGLAVVQAHNVWTLRAPLLVTLVGWSALILGFVRMAIPNQHVQVDSQNIWQMYIVCGILYLIGVCLSLMGYS